LYSFAADCNEENIEDIQLQANFMLEECAESSPYRNAIVVKCLNKLKDEELTDSTIAASDYVTALYE